MVSSELLQTIRLDDRVPVHVAVIMDGNGRWASARGLPRHRGHSAGMDSVREVIEGAVEAGVGVLTLFAFSRENWSRPRREVSALMKLLRLYVRREQAQLRQKGVEVRVFGETQLLPSPARTAVAEIERTTAGGQRLRVNLMISYGGRQELVRAMRLLAERIEAGALTADEIDEDALESALYTHGLPDPDLLIRTSGERRISNFMLWQLAYTELYVTPVLWPDFTREHFFAALQDYQQRERRFGRVTTG